MSDHQILTDAQLAEIEARANAATPGPWHEDGRVLSASVEAGRRDGYIRDIGTMDNTRDLEFIAEAREDVPALIASHRAQGEEIKRLREALAGVLNAFDDLTAQSHGVDGLHLNGDVAPWVELLEGGRFEEWTEPQFSAARAALNTAARGEDGKNV